MTSEHKSDWYEDVGHGRVHIFCDCEECEAKRWLDEIAHPRGVYQRTRGVGSYIVECLGGGGSGGGSGK